MFGEIHHSVLRRDRDLARRMCAGNDDAIPEFCSTSLPVVYRFAHARVAIEADADDVVQNVMRNAARRIETYRGRGTLLAWLLAICRHELSKRHASAARAPATVHVDAPVRQFIELIEA